MRRWLAATVAVAALTVATPAFAQAAPAKPVDALKKQFVAGQGVKVKETTRTWIDNKDYIGATREGVIEFGPKGVAAAETVRTPVISEAVKKELAAEANKSEDAADAVELLTERIYLVSVGRRYYVNGGIFSMLLPDDKLWVGGTGDPSFAAYGDQLINVFEPATLKALLATGKHKGDQYRGSLTFAELYRLSPSFRTQLGIKPSGAAGKFAISWRLTLDQRKLAKRLAIDWSMPLTKKVTIKGSTETRYYDWGTESSITAPPADQVIGIADLAKKGLEPPTPIDRDYVDVPPSDDGTVQ